MPRKAPAAEVRDLEVRAAAEAVVLVREAPALVLVAAVERVVVREHLAPAQVRGVVREGPAGLVVRICGIPRVVPGAAQEQARVEGELVLAEVAGPAAWGPAALEQVAAARVGLEGQARVVPAQDPDREVEPEVAAGQDLAADRDRAVAAQVVRGPAQAGARALLPADG